MTRGRIQPSLRSTVQFSILILRGRVLPRMPGIGARARLHSVASDFLPGEVQHSIPETQKPLN